MRGVAVGRPLCGAKKKSGGTCKWLAGRRTPHPGLGKCWKHGGLTPIKHGRYSKVHHERLLDLAAHQEANPDPLNILPELALIRALAVDYINRYEENTAALIAWHQSFQSPDARPKPRRVLDITAVIPLISEATKIVERIERINAVNAISRPDLNRLLNELGRVVATFVDPPIAQKIKELWLAVKV